MNCECFRVDEFVGASENEIFILFSGIFGDARECDTDKRSTDLDIYFTTAVYMTIKTLHKCSINFDQMLP